MVPKGLCFSKILKVLQPPQENSTVSVDHITMEEAGLVLPLGFVPFSSIFLPWILQKRKIKLHYNAPVLEAIAKRQRLILKDKTKRRRERERGQCCNACEAIISVLPFHNNCK